MKRFPDEFAALLNRAPSRIGHVRLTNARPFAAIAGAIDPETTRAAASLLERRMAPHLMLLSRSIPPESIANQTRNHQERLPKTVRVRTAYLEREASAATRAAEAIGLVTMLRSASLRAFAERVSGRKLAEECGQQVLCYRPGDYAGPHTDHHPEDARAKSGYLDVHVSFATDGVAGQSLVYARRGHLSEVVNIGPGGLITAYRLPFWHYTTPLIAKPGPGARARRWVLLATFLFADQSAAADAGSR